VAVSFEQGTNVVIQEEEEEERKKEDYKVMVFEKW
jgi:hypothetical protein